MILSKSTKETFRILRNLGGPLIIQAPNTFTVFGTGKKDGAVEQGTIVESFNSDFVINDLKLATKNMKATSVARMNKKSLSVTFKTEKYSYPFDFDEKSKELIELADRLNLLFETKKLGSIFLPESIVAQFQNTARFNKLTHVNFIKKSDRDLIMTAADLTISNDRVWKYRGGAHSLAAPISGYKGEELNFSIKTEVFCLLDKSDYRIKFYKDGMAEFISINTGIAYLLRDQKVSDLFDGDFIDQHH